MLKRGRTLRGSLSLIIILGALLPSLVIASYLIERFRTVSEEMTLSALEQAARLLNYEMQREYDLMLAAASQLSADPDIIYTAYTGAFGAKANRKLAKLGQLYPSIFGAMVVDSHGWPVEVTPTPLSLIDMAPISPLIKDFFSQQQEAKAQLLTLRDKDFVEDIHQLQYATPAQQALRSDHLFLILSPLYLSAVDKTELYELVGAMVAILPVHTLLEETQKRLLNAKEFDIEILDLKVQGLSVLRNESKLSNLDDYIVLEAPMRLSHGGKVVEWTLGSKRSVALKHIDELQLELWLIVVALAFLLCAAAYLGTRYLIQPIDKVNQLVASYAAADFSQRSLTLPFRELQQMANVLEQMAQRIIEDQHKLEQRVARRTQDLQQANEELHATMAQLQATQEQLVEAEKMSQLGQLVAGIAHEINTPVGVAMTAITMLEQHVKDIELQVDDGKLTRNRLLKHLDNSKQMGEMIVKNLRRAANLISNFKEVAADQTGEDLRQFELYQYIQIVLRNLEPDLKPYRVVIDVVGSQELSLQSYPGAFSQIISNLVLNSLKHGFSKHRQHHIDIAFESRDDQLMLCYQDDGRGIDAVTLPRIFDPFFTTQRSDGGTGLGLHIVYNVVHQRLGGTIEAHSDVGGGVEFIIRVPLSPPPVES